MLGEAASYHRTLRFRRCTMAILETFPQFNRLPTELQLKVYRHAFSDSNGFQAWIDFALSALQYLGRGLAVPTFWKSPRYQLRPGLAVVLGAQRRIIVYHDMSIPNLLSSCRLARQVALEEWRKVFLNLLIPLNVPCEIELRHVEETLAQLKIGKAGCLRCW